MFFSWCFYFLIFLFRLQGLFSQNVADIIAQVEKMEVDKGGNLVSIPVGGVCAIDEFLSVIVESEEDFVLHGFNVLQDHKNATIIFCFYKKNFEPVSKQRAKSPIIPFKNRAKL